MIIEKYGTYALINPSETANTSYCFNTLHISLCMQHQRNISLEFSRHSEPYVQNV